MKHQYSNLSRLIYQSDIRSMSIECDKVNGINLSQGICDLPINQRVALAAKKAIDSGCNHYSQFDGLPELKKAISLKLRSYNHINASEENIIVSAGATGALYIASLALLNPGDEVILFEPYYGYHLNNFQAVGAVPVYVKLYPPDWHFKIKELEKVITSKTKAIMINTPANPCGKVFSLDELNQIAVLTNKYNLIVFTDEIYEYFVYGEKKHISPGSIKSFNNKVVTISGYSKTYSITGWRIGYLVCQKDWVQMIGYMNDMIYVCAPTPLQMGVAGGINKLPDKYYSRLCQLFSKKRNIICEYLQKAGLTPNIPQGSYYVLANASIVPGKTDKEKALYLLHKTKVAAVPGSAFYHSDKNTNLLRFCFAKDDSVLHAAGKRLLKLTK